MKKDHAMLDLTPEQFRELGYRAVDIIAEMLAGLPDAPARRAVPSDLRRQLLEQPLPTDSHSPAELLEIVAAQTMPHPLGNISPRFLAWLNPPSAPLGTLADTLPAPMNPSEAGRDHAATQAD